MEQHDMIRTTFKELEKENPWGTEEHRMSLSLKSRYCSTCVSGSKSIDMNKRTLELRKKVLGKKHPETIITHGNLSLDLSYAQRHDEGCLEAEEALRLYRLVTGERFPE